jgi:hypothetical protein
MIVEGKFDRVHGEKVLDTTGKYGFRTYGAQRAAATASPRCRSAGSSPALVCPEFKDSKAPRAAKRARQR